MILSELIKILEQYPEEKIVAKGFGSPDSYRGYYEQIAFHPCNSTTVGAMLAHARSAIGETFTGYKGGEYRMDGNSIVNIAHYGMCTLDDEDEITPTSIRCMIDAPVNERDTKQDARKKAIEYAAECADNQHEGYIFGHSDGHYIVGPISFPYGPEVETPFGWCNSCVSHGVRSTKACEGCETAKPTRHEFA